ncbi:hypothetical protein PLESTF_001442100 [Pleodorina starrii]|nr:hypothetical protein PLESTF_001442100 [Pleodorina starrii]
MRPKRYTHSERVNVEQLKLWFGSRRLARTEWNADVVVRILPPYGGPAGGETDPTPYRQINRLLADTFKRNADQVGESVFRGRSDKDPTRRLNANTDLDACLAAGLWLGGDLVCAMSFRINVPQASAASAAIYSRTHIQILFQATSEKHRRRGLGRLLTRYILEQAAVVGGHQFTTVSVADKDVISYWREKMGFVEPHPRDRVGQRAVEEGKEHLRAALLIHDLKGTTAEAASQSVLEAVQKLRGYGAVAPTVEGDIRLDPGDGHARAVAASAAAGGGSSGGGSEAPADQAAAQEEAEEVAPAEADSRAAAAAVAVRATVPHKGIGVELDQPATVDGEVGEAKEVQQIVRLPSTRSKDATAAVMQRTGRRKAVLQGSLAAAATAAKPVRRRSARLLKAAASAATLLGGGSGRSSCHSTVAAAPSPAAAPVVAAGQALTGSGFCGATAAPEATTLLVAAQKETVQLASQATAAGVAAQKEPAEAVQMEGGDTETTVMHPAVGETQQQWLDTGLPNDTDQMAAQAAELAMDAFCAQQTAQPFVFQGGSFGSTLLPVFSQIVHGHTMYLQEYFLDMEKDLQHIYQQNNYAELNIPSMQAAQAAKGWANLALKYMSGLQGDICYILVAVQTAFSAAAVGASSHSTTIIMQRGREAMARVASIRAILVAAATQLAEAVAKAVSVTGRSTYAVHTAAMAKAAAHKQVDILMKPLGRVIQASLQTVRENWLVLKSTDRTTMAPPEVLENAALVVNKTFFLLNEVDMFDMIVCNCVALGSALSIVIDEGVNSTASLDMDRLKGSAFEAARKAVTTLRRQTLLPPLTSEMEAAAEKSIAMLQENVRSHSSRVKGRRARKPSQASRDHLRQAVRTLLTSAKLVVVAPAPTATAIAGASTAAAPAAAAAAAGPSTAVAAAPASARCGGSSGGGAGPEKAAQKRARDVEDSDAAAATAPSTARSRVHGYSVQ